MEREDDRSDLRLDQLYKLTLEDLRVLAMHLRLLKEFDGMDDGSILECVDLTPGEKAAKINAELYSPDGPAYADSAFRVRMPDSGRETTVFIEGQGWIGNWKRLYNRMILYGSRFLDAGRRAGLADDKYEDLLKSGGSSWYSTLRQS